MIQLEVDDINGDFYPEQTVENVLLIWMLFYHNDGFWNGVFDIDVDLCLTCFKHLPNEQCYIYIG